MQLVVFVFFYTRILARCKRFFETFYFVAAFYDVLVLPDFVSEFQVKGEAFRPCGF